MKRACLVALVIASLLSIPRKAFAQTPSYRASDHLELGIWGEFYHFDQADLNLAGVDARLSGNVTPLLQLEADGIRLFPGVHRKVLEWGHHGFD